MIKCRNGNISISGGAADVLGEVGWICHKLAGELGDDEVLQAVLVGLYANSKTDAAAIHDKLMEGGII